MYRETWFEINLDAIKENVKTIKQLNGKHFIAVLKANAYGCGDIQVAKAVIEAGAKMIAVSSLEEALVLRKEGYEGELLILGAIHPCEVELLKQENITTTAFSMAWIQEIKKEKSEGLKVHLKIDTGMNRIGFKTIQEAKEALACLLDIGCQVEGVYTHFACADTNLDRTQQQFEQFKTTVEALDYPFKWIHCDNSDGAVIVKEDFTNACRVGISLYGISTYAKQLKPALSFYTKIIHIKQVDEGETIGYGATYQAQEKQWIGTMPVGYADGFVRANQNRLVYIDGEYCPVVGRVCMDQAMVKLPHEVPIGSLVELFGPHIPLEKMAEELHTIPYEIICLISSRVTRRYRQGNDIIEEDNLRLESVD